MTRLMTCRAIVIGFCNWADLKFSGIIRIYAGRQEILLENLQKDSDFSEKQQVLAVDYRIEFVMRPCANRSYECGERSEN